MDNIFKKTSIAFLGRPNVGKSTLFNALQKNVYAIVSPKPQTTRNYICSKLTLDNNRELIFVDTPGFHNPMNKLDFFLNAEIKYVIKNVDILCYIIDPTKEFNDEDEQVLKLIKNLDIKNAYLIINKIDIAENNKIDIYLNKIKEIFDFENINRIAAADGTNLDELITSIKITIDKLEEFNDNSWQEPTDEFIAKEIIRQSCLANLSMEIPYGIGVLINNYSYDNDKKMLNIDADIYVEKDSQKIIVIGKGGNMIKAIGTQARMELLNLYDCKIMLKLFVKIKKNWRDDNNLVKQMGYLK